MARSTGVKGQRSLEELRVETGLDAGTLNEIVSGLVDRRMVRSLGGGQVEIVHDHLAQLVYQELGSEERRIKRLRELLDLKVGAYVTTPVPLSVAEMAGLYAVREQIAPDDDQMRLLLHSCLAERGPAWYWLRDASTSRILSWLRDGLARPMPSLRQSAVSIVAQVAGQEATPNLREMLKDGEPAVRRAATEALAQVAGRDAFPDLREMLKDEDGDVRGAATEALAEVAEQDAIPDLREMLKDEDPAVRREAALVLPQVTGRDAIPDLRDMLKVNEGDDVRWAVVWALEGLVTEEDLTWLAEGVASQPWARWAESANEVLIHVDRRLYFELRFGVESLA